MVELAMSILFAIAGTTDGKPLKYEAALKKADKEKKPLVILVGADWCASCQIMKRETMQPMQKDGQLDKVVVTYVDKDQNPELAEKLMKGPTLPQVIVFNKKDGKWKRFSLTGMQSKKRMKELLARAGGKIISEQVLR
ncbi:MAG: thioredoxin family protein [Planctomycetota bacterium]|nr:thioredoxin family protein [Planctomycetota bacterium]